MEFVAEFDGIPTRQLSQRPEGREIMSMRLLTHAEQVAVHLRAGISCGRWSGTMPGILALGRQLGVNHNTVDAALELLEGEGFLESRGKGRARRIVRQEPRVRQALRIGILLFEGAERMQAATSELRHRLVEAGHDAVFAAKTQQDLGMSVKRVARHIREHEVDAWVVSAAPREVLEWFAEQSFPTFAMFGRMAGLPVAGMSPRKAPALAAAMRRLAALGHRRIVLLTRGENNFERPSLFERAFLDELGALGIPAGPYHLPGWGNTREAFFDRLDALFRVTPPTALIICEPPQLIAAQLHLAQRGVLAPRDVSLVCDDPDPVFEWCRPSVAHIDWDVRPILHRIAQWADRIAEGKTDHRQSRSASRFVEGATIGPAA